MHSNQQYSPVPKVLFAVTVSISCGFYRNKLAYLRDAGFDVTIISGPGELLETLSKSEGATPVAIPMEREISPLKDLVSLWKFYRAIKRVKPDLVDVSTPKAGLLGSIAAMLAGVPCRVYTLRGLRMETATGLKRGMLWLAEWISCACAHRVVPVSESLRRRAVELKLVTAAKTGVLERGSGVDLSRFTPRRRGSAETHGLRQELRLTGKETVIGFVGRFVKDKGIRELVEAFRELGTTRPNLRLLLVGDFESGDPVEPEVRKYIESAPTILRPGFVADTAPYYALMDVFVLPTYREGFPEVPLEAQASRVPVVTTTATGAVDSVVDGETGFLVPVGDSSALAGAIAKLLEDPQLRLRMGIAGRARMERDFRPAAIWDAHVKMYEELLNENATMRDERRDTSTALKTAGLVAKRAFDLVWAMVGLVVLAPILLMVAVLVKIFLGSPILFHQSRPGWNGKLFTCLKFRTMTDARDAEGRLLPDAERMMAFGRFLRRSSIDELPELINVIRGEMSLVGPRPLLPQYLERYTPEQMRRHEVKPGITGWAQINGRNATSWEQKFAYDVWYVKNRGFWLDLKILALTLWKTLKREGISQPGHATMQEFRSAARPE